MNVIIRPALQADAEAVATFLHTHMNPRIPVARWRNLFEFPWPLPADARDYGRVAEADGRVVGFISRIYSERMIGGRRELIANISSWYLRKDFRHSSVGLDLYRQLLDDRGPASYTVVSIAKRTYPLYDRWGFGLLDQYRWLWRRRQSRADTIDVITERKHLIANLDTSQFEMLTHHSRFDLWPVIIRAPEGDCLAVLTAKRKAEDVLFLDVLHLSSPELFERYANEVASQLLTEESAVLAVDARFLSDNPPDAERVAIPVPRRYLSDHLSPSELDFMYSETLLLDLKLS